MKLRHTRSYPILLALLAGPFVPGAGAQIATAFEGRLTPADIEFLDAHGTDVAIDGDLILVSSAADDDQGLSAGAVYAYARGPGGVWTEEAKIFSSMPAFGERFGTSVALSGNLAAVGAPTAITAGASNGAVYALARSGTTWTTTARLTVTDPMNPLGLSGPVARDGDTIAVGGPDFGSNRRGCVYVFRRQTGGAWILEAQLQGADQQPFQGLGQSVALQGDLLVAGAPDDDDTAGDAGAVYVFRRQGTTWTQEAKLQASQATDDDHLGASVALDGDTLVAGAPDDDELAQDGGAAVVFRRSGTSWSQEAVLGGLAAFDEHGAAVAVEGDRCAVGAPGRIVPPSGTAGAVLVYERTGTSWALVDFILSTGGFQARLGDALALRTDRLVAGSPNEGFGTGAAYVHALQGGAATYCQGKVNSLGCLSRTSTTGSPSASSSAPFLVEAIDVLPGEPGVLLYGFGPANLDFHGGKLCIDPPFTTRVPPKTAQSSGGGTCPGVLRSNFQKRIQSGIDPRLSVGQTVYAQWRQRDPADPTGFGDALTDAVRFTIAP